MNGLEVWKLGQVFVQLVGPGRFSPSKPRKDARNKTRHKSIDTIVHSVNVWRSPGLHRGRGAARAAGPGVGAAGEYAEVGHHALWRGQKGGWVGWPWIFLRGLQQSRGGHS